MARVYTYSVIAVGIMFLLLVGGVKTNSSVILTAVGGINPSFWSSFKFWGVLATAILAFGATTRLSIFGNTIQLSREAVTSVFVLGIYVAFISDMFSILTKVGSLTCPTIGATVSILSCSWEYWIAWGLIVPLVVGYGISLISFIGGSD